jgi:hypothetical protein
MLADARRVDALGQAPAVQRDRQRRDVDGLVVDPRLQAGEGLGEARDQPLAALPARRSSADGRLPPIYGQ